MIKRSIVKKVEVLDKKDKQGNILVRVSFMNDDHGIYLAPPDEVNHFQEGQEMPYQMLIRKKSDGVGSWWQIKKAPDNGTPKSSTGEQTKEREALANAAIMAAGYTKDLVVAGKIDAANYIKYTKKIYDVIAGLIKQV